MAQPPPEAPTPTTSAERLAACLRAARANPGGPRILVMVNQDDLEAVLSGASGPPIFPRASMDEAVDHHNTAFFRQALSLREGMICEGASFSDADLILTSALASALLSYLSEVGQSDEEIARQLSRMAETICRGRADAPGRAPAVDGMPVEQLVQLAHDLEGAPSLEASDASR